MDRRIDDLARSVVAPATRRLAVPALLASFFGASRIGGAEAKADEKPGRPDFSKAKTVELEGKPLEERGASAARSADGPETRATTTSLGVRRIYYSDNCSTNSAVFCSVACPRTMQAVGGGVLDMSLNAELLFDRPTTQVNRWESLVLSLNGGQANAVPFAVCMRK